MDGKPTHVITKDDECWFFRYVAPAGRIMRRESQFAQCPRPGLRIPVCLLHLALLDPSEEQKTVAAGAIEEYGKTGSGLRAQHPLIAPDSVRDDLGVPGFSGHVDVHFMVFDTPLIPSELRLHQGQGKVGFRTLMLRSIPRTSTSYIEILTW